LHTNLKIGFIGAGKVGTALGLFFKEHGLQITGYASRTLESADRAALLTQSQAYSTFSGLISNSTVVFITVPDLAIESVADQAAELIKKHETNQATLPCWMHTSGALSSQSLSSLGELGCPVGSLHPLLSFGDPADSAQKLKQAFFSIEGSERALQVMWQIMTATGSQFGLINEKQKPIYHTAACIMSNYLVTLLESGFRCFEAAGLDRRQISPAVQQLIASTLANVVEKGTAEALTGPIVRGDYNTLQIHLQALGEHLLSERGFYKALVLKTIDMIAGTRISKLQEYNLLRVLEET